MRCTNWGPAHLLLSRVGHCMAFGFSLHGSTRLCLWHSFEPPANQEYVALGHDMLCGFSVLAFRENHQDAPLFGDTIIYWDLFALVLHVTTVFFQISIVQLSWHWIPSIELSSWWSWWNWKPWDTSRTKCCLVWNAILLSRVDFPGIMTWPTTLCSLKSPGR